MHRELSQGPGYHISNTDCVPLNTCSTVPLRSETVALSFRLVAEGDTVGQAVSCEGSCVPMVGRAGGFGGCRVVCSILSSQPWDLVSKIKESHVMCCDVTLGAMPWPPH